MSQTKENRINIFVYKSGVTKLLVWRLSPICYSTFVYKSN